MKRWAIWIAIFTILLCCAAARLRAQSWTRGLNRAPYNDAETPLLLKDGRLFVHFSGDNLTKWEFYTPDAKGSYVNGTWSAAASFPADYGPHNFESAVFPSGDVGVCGGEYNFGNPVWMARCFVWHHIQNQWQEIQAPKGWHSLGDSASVLLSNGNWLVSDCCSNQWAILDTKTLTWTATGGALIARNHESMAILLQDDTVSMTDVSTNVPCLNSNTSSEIWDMASGKWHCGPQLPTQLYGPPDYEAGPPILLYNGQVFQSGGNTISGTVLRTSAEWLVGPVATGMDQDDGVAALEPNGKVLGAWRTNGHQNCQFMEYVPETNNIVPTANPDPLCPSQGDIPSFRLINVPSGQIALSAAGYYLVFYTPTPGFVASAAPQIISIPVSMKGFQVGQTYTLYGSQLNSLSQATPGEDDKQESTNYPIVRLTDSLGNVTYAFTHDGNYSGIAPGTISYTLFDVPQLASGAYMLQVVTNGIPSNTVRVVIR